MIFQPRADDTPMPVVDLAIVEANLKRMQAYCDSHGLKLRPHIKTHKMPGLAKWQLDLGAVGITCQKLGEAEIMIDAGITDILISYPLIGPVKAARLAGLARRATLAVVADSPLAVDTAAEAARAAGATIRVLVEFESGGRRAGVASPADALALAHRMGAASGLTFGGLMTYPLGPEAAAFIAEAKALFAAEGIAMPEISAGGTPRAFHAHEVPGVTELRVGTYIYNDRNTVDQGAASLDDCALHIEATVVSRPTADRAIIDAGSKSLSSDLTPGGPARGYGLMPDYPEAVIVKLNEEHGIVDLSACARRPEIGETVRIIPNHVCVVVNLHDEILMTRPGAPDVTMPVDARGRSR
ncbi:alanine racemase [Chelatococcus asaccharovorans]|uniref:D-serine deaminase-like pyridoxal phosphate-dependent protein n=1 Tax=Chelatococcus asaccharovorans TaxID=28210 RepID=A0A2V3TVI8_9HYPH|nr:alanine racemase [Chelatococcus asaccharovorans]MBS7702163.1 alanine racemase [Chelatococcus asaccharovorans]PXW52932.1 D-serine deaminase-like pyridoxal phosphate-dependent protein [Chelatococcus asaccharovorans]